MVEILLNLWQECEWKSEDEDGEEEELAEGVKEKAKVEDKKAEIADKEGDQTKGVPSFWLTIFKNVEMLAEMVQVSPSIVILRLCTLYNCAKKPYSVEWNNTRQMAPFCLTCCNLISITALQLGNSWVSLKIG